jgi:hypothetical protein
MRLEGRGYGDFPRRIFSLAHPARGHQAPLGTVVVILNVIVVFAPIPLSNIVPALVIALISLAYLEEDGVLFSIAPVAAILVLAVAAAAVWGTVLGAEWIGGLW